jgi:bifunctional DNase/RNase
MRVIAVGRDPSGSGPVLLLQETAGEHRVLPVWIGMPEATAIEFERQHVDAPRPLTHQLIAAVIRACGRRLEQVRITMVRDNIFHAELVIDGDTRVSARVSDAVSLALHLDVPIRAEDAVLDQAALAAVELMGTTGEGEDVPAGTAAEAPVDEAEELEEFRRFLDTASPEDFDKG